jgi:cysteinyl-tRNA synthetase
VSEWLQNWGEPEKKIFVSLTKTQETVDKCLKDNFDTAGAIFYLLGLIRHTNSYSKNNNDRRVPLLKNIARFGNLNVSANCVTAT